MAIVVDMEKICSEMLDVLERNKVPVCALDRVLQHLKELAYCNTPIQNVDLENEFNS